jgi:hypothetical protein
MAVDNPYDCVVLLPPDLDQNMSFLQGEEDISIVLPRVFEEAEK